MYYPPNIVYGMSDILVQGASSDFIPGLQRSNLEHPDLHLNEDEKKDEEIVEMEMRYQQKVKLLKEKLEINLRLVDEVSGSNRIHGYWWLVWSIFFIQIRVDFPKFYREAKSIRRK